MPMHQQARFDTPLLPLAAPETSPPALLAWAFPGFVPGQGDLFAGSERCKVCLSFFTV